MPENENNDVMNDDIANLPEGDADTEGGTEGTEGSEGNAGDGEGGMEGGDGEGENGTEGTDGLEDGGSAGDEDLSTDGGMMGGSDDMFTNIGGMDGMMGGDMGDMGTETGVKDPILSNIPFVSITIGAALVVGIVLGILLGKKRIKKGFDLYEN